MLSRIYLIVVASCWTLLLGGLALAEEALSPSRSLTWYLPFSIPLWAAAWAVGRPSLAGRIVRWVCVFSLVVALYVLWDGWRLYWTPLAWPFQLPFVLLLSAAVVLVVPELKQLRDSTTTKHLARDVALATAVTALALGGYFLYQRGANAENMRLRAMVAGELDEIALPPDSVFIYEEVEANRNCKTASIRKVYASQIKPVELCSLVSGPLAAKGWAILDECRALTYPFIRRSVGETLPSFDFARLVARRRPSGLVELVAQPKESWGLRYSLSEHGRSKAVPLARQAGSFFFTIHLYKSEEPDRVKRLCPDEGGRCECGESTLFAWRFA